MPLSTFFGQEDLQQVVQEGAPQRRRLQPRRIIHHQPALHGLAQLHPDHGRKQARALLEQRRVHPFGQAQRVQHELEGQIGGLHHLVDLAGIAGQRRLHVAARVLVLCLPDDPVRERQLAVGAGPDAQVIAKHPVIEVVLGLMAGARPGRHLVVAIGVTQHLAQQILHGSRLVFVRHRGREARKQRVGLQREVVARQVRRRERQGLRQVCAQLGQRLLGQRIHQVQVEGLEQLGGCLGRRTGLSPVMHAPQRLQLGVREALDAQRQAVDARSPVIGKARPLEGARVGLHRHLGIGNEGQPGPQTGQQPVNGRPRKQAGRTATNEHRHHPAPPDQRQAGIQVGLQRRQIGVLVHPIGRQVVRVEVAIRTLSQTPRDVDIHRERRQVVQLHAAAGMQADGRGGSRHGQKGR